MYNGRQKSNYSLKIESLGRLLPTTIFFDPKRTISRALPSLAKILLITGLHLTLTHRSIRFLTMRHQEFCSEYQSYFALSLSKLLMGFTSGNCAIESNWFESFCLSIASIIERILRFLYIFNCFFFSKIKLYVYFITSLYMYTYIYIYIQHFVYF